jgi:hypothetical protein
VLLAYLPMYWYRKRYEDPRDAPAAAADETSSMIAAPGSTTP